MIRDVRDALFAIGGATVFVALAGLALHNDLILTVGLNSTGIVFLAYAGVAFGVAGANIVAVIRSIGSQSRCST